MEITEQLSGTRLHDISPPSNEAIIESIRINPKNYLDAFVNNPDGGQDIYIDGVQARSAALEGDIVQVELNHYSKWKLNFTSIANHWDEWSKYLEPIIKSIEESESVPGVQGEPIFQSNHVNSLTATPSEQWSEGVDVFHLRTESNQTEFFGIDGNRSSTRSKRSKRNAQRSQTETEAYDDMSPSKKRSPQSKLPSNLPSNIAKLVVAHVINLPFSSQCIQKTGRVVKIIKSMHMGLAGGFLRPFSRELALFVPTDSRVPRMLIDINECPLDFATQSDRYKGILFVAHMTKWDGSRFADGNLVKIIGDCNAIQSHMEAILVENRIFDEDFPPDAYAELEYLNDLPQDWIKQHCQGRRDLTNECVFTIDPKTARDLDDAMSIKQVAEQIYEVGVHIADVSYFVKELSAVDYYARQRTTSVYLVDRVIPMLPRILCEQVCSLDSGEPKLTFSVIWKMDKYGRIIDQWFGRTVIKSCAKLAYEQVQDILDKPDDLSWIKEGVNMPKLHAFDWRQVAKSCVLLNKIAQNLRAKRFEDGALRIDQVKIKFELDPSSGYPTGFAFETRTAANYLIEEYMLLANMAVAKKIYQHDKDHAFLRRHPSSSPQLLKEVKDFCDAKGCPLNITSSGSIQKSLNSITDLTMRKVVSFLLLRAMKNAEYICTGALTNDDSSFRHFALNVPFYTHFTSPIRRYADLVVHRFLGIALDYEKESNENVSSLALIADECTKRKVSSKKISETSQKLYFNLFVQKAGYCELLACVARIYDQSFDVILVDYNRTGRVYLDKLKTQLESFKMESFAGIRRMVLNWKTTELKKETKKKNKNKNKIKDEETEKLNTRSHLESGKAFCHGSDLRINEAVDNKQKIEMFDVIKVIVTIDPKDITQLKIDLKAPNQS